MSTPTPTPTPITKELSEPWFTLVQLGLKTIEGRLDKNQFKIGDTITFYNNDIFYRSCTVKITNITKHKTFREYLTFYNLQDCLPGICTVEDGLKVYYKYFTKEEEYDKGVIALILRN